MTERAKNLLASMKLSEREGVLVYNPSNMFYLSGYLGEGLVLITHQCCAIVTDFRYTEQAENEAPGFEVHMTGTGRCHEAIVGELCRQADIDTLYYEDDYVTVRTFEACRKHISDVEWKSVGGAVEALREVKDENELSLIAQACKLTGEAFERLLPNIKEGMTEREVAEYIVSQYDAAGCDDTSFMPIVSYGANAADPHHEADDTRLKAGDCIVIDMGCRKDRYCSDMTRTFFCKSADPKFAAIHDIVREANELAESLIKPGIVLSELDKAARDHIAKAGYGEYFTHRLGHFIGQTDHEKGDVSAVSTIVAKQGMIFSIEPGVYLPGEFGVRIEDLVLVTEDGCEILNKVDKHWNIVG